MAVDGTYRVAGRKKQQSSSADLEAALRGGHFLSFLSFSCFFLSILDLVKILTLWSLHNLVYPDNCLPRFSSSSPIVMCCFCLLFEDKIPTES